MGIRIGGVRGWWFWKLEFRVGVWFGLGLRRRKVGGRRRRYYIIHLLICFTVYFFIFFFIFTWLGPSISRFSFSFIFYLLFLGIQDSRFKIQKKKEDGEGNEDGDAESGRER